MALGNHALFLPALPTQKSSRPNVILFVTNHKEQDGLVLRRSEEVDWRKWMHEHASADED